MDRTEVAGGSARPGAAVAIGNFDGVHSGHRMLVARAIEAATQAGLRSVVLTFDRHPATIVRPASAPRLLTSVERKIELLRATGVDEVEVLRFDAERASESAEDFVRSYLVEGLGTRVVVVGTSFRFGHRHSGDVALLESMGAELGFSVVCVDLVADDQARSVVSSSRIRELVAHGNLGEAAELLGRPHEVNAVVLPGVSAGEHAGNVAIEVAPDLLVPPPGTYAGYVALGRVDRPNDHWQAAEISVVPPASEPSGDDATPVSPVLRSFVIAPVELAVTLAANGSSPPAGEVRVRFSGPSGGEGR